MQIEVEKGDMFKPSPLKDRYGNELELFNYVLVRNKSDDELHFSKAFVIISIRSKFCILQNVADPEETKVLPRFKLETNVYLDPITKEEAESVKYKPCWNLDESNRLRYKEKAVGVVQNEKLGKEIIKQLNRQEVHI